MRIFKRQPFYSLVTLTALFITLLPTISLSTETSPSSYYKALIADIESGKKAPALSDFFVQWGKVKEPSSSSRHLGYKPYYYTKDRFAPLPNSCKPEVIYSWGDAVKLQDLIHRMGRTPFGSVEFNHPHDKNDFKS